MEYPTSHEAILPASHIDFPKVAKTARGVFALGIQGVVDGLFQKPPHHHPEAHLILSLRGHITCEVAKGQWLVPRECALWIPGGVEHSIRIAGDVAACLLFIEPGVAPGLPAECTTFAVRPLLRELMIEVSSLPPGYDPHGADGRLVQTMLDQLSMASVESLHLPMPTDKRLRQIADCLTVDPSNALKTGEWAQEVGMSERSLLRLTTAQTGMSFGRWRQQFQVLFAVQALSQGASVQSVAFDLRYESASAFITMFKKIMGEPPGKYTASRRAGARSPAAR